MASLTWSRFFGVSPPGAGTPLVENANLLVHVPPGDSTRRAITTMELGVVCQAAGAAAIDHTFVDFSEFAYGLVMTDQPLTPSVSPTPLTNPNALAPSDWGQWEYLQPTMLVQDLNAPELEIWSWRTPTPVDTQFRRRAMTGSSADIWLPWEILDGSGLIGTTTAGVTYSLYARFSCEVLFNVP
jgi:hypothetical protein